MVDNILYGFCAVLDPAAARLLAWTENRASCLLQSSEHNDIVCSGVRDQDLEVACFYKHRARCSMRSLRDTLDALKLDTLALKAFAGAFAAHDTFNHLKVEELYHAPFISSMNLGAF